MHPNIQIKYPCISVTPKLKCTREQNLKFKLFIIIVNICQLTVSTLNAIRAAHIEMKRNITDFPITKVLKNTGRCHALMRFDYLPN